MVVNDNEEQGFIQMHRLSFLEFLEFFARLATVRFLNSEMEGLPLAEKLAHLMDEVFPSVLGCERNKQKEEELVSESDDDY